jgi:hypothetical protein
MSPCIRNFLTLLPITMDLIGVLAGAGTAAVIFGVSGFTNIRDGFNPSWIALHAGAGALGAATGTYLKQPNSITEKAIGGAIAGIAGVALEEYTGNPLVAGGITAAGVTALTYA